MNPILAHIREQFLAGFRDAFSFWQRRDEGMNGTAIFVDWLNWAIGFEIHRSPGPRDPLGMHRGFLVMLGPIILRHYHTAPRAR